MLVTGLRKMGGTRNEINVLSGFWLIINHSYNFVQFKPLEVLESELS